MMVIFVIMSATDDTIYQGRVKWFNNKTGYGFVTVIDGDKEGTDVFAHHSGINVDDEQYKYLVQGEYIQFNLSNVESSDNYKYQAAGITGIKKGKLLCETRNENRTTMSSKPGDNSSSNNTERPRNMNKSRPRGAGPRDNKNTNSQSTTTTISTNNNTESR